MLVKEYRICLPLTVEEYRIAQLYMIQKKSREESSGTGSAVEIIHNDPYTDGPGGSGQYTYKIFHIGSHLPGWLKAILPKSALRVEEEAWNAYPYTKTRYKCPFVEKFLLEIETRYLNDAGEQENIFHLEDSELRSRQIDYLDIVTDPVADYHKEEDPRFYVSEKTGRGPLLDDWRNQYSEAQKANSRDKHIMCAYKMCKVEFRYWGMQTKIERFIHDIALRKTMLRAHRQAWCWQDEYHGLTIEDIRALERETQKALEEKMNKFREAEEATENGTPRKSSLANHNNKESEFERGVSDTGNAKRISWGKGKSQGQFKAWKVESLEKLRSDSSSEDEFFDAKSLMSMQEDEDRSRHHAASPSSLYRSSSMEMVTSGSEDYQDCNSPANSAFFAGASFDQKVEYYRHLYPERSLSQSLDSPAPDPSSSRCKITVLFLVLHGGSILESGHDLTTKRADLLTLKMTFDKIIRAHFPAAQDRVALRMVPCPPVSADALSTLSSLSPYSFDMTSPHVDGPATHTDNLPLGAIPILTSTSHEYRLSIGSVMNKCNEIFSKFVKSEEGCGFSGQVCLIADCIGSLYAHDIMTTYSVSRLNSHASNSDPDDDPPVFRRSTLETIKQMSVSNPDLSPTEEHDRKPSLEVHRQESMPSSPGRRHLSIPCRQSVDGCGLEFDVTDCFLLGSPLALVLAYRRAAQGDHKSAAVKRPLCHQIYNLFHLSDPSAGRLEPLIHKSFKFVSPVKLARYNKYPLGDGESVHLVEALQENSQLLETDPPERELQRRVSSISMASQCSGYDVNLSAIAAVSKAWWGAKRLDYALYCPEALHSFPSNTLPCLMHASYWESADAVSFILRQTVRHDRHVRLEASKDTPAFTPSQPREKWLKRRTTIKLRNVAPNHRANDVIVLEDVKQILVARFMYGPLDMVSLSGEKVDIHIMNQPPGGEWVNYGTAVTDGNGRLTFEVPKEQRLNMGMYPVKMVVRGDHTYVDFYLTVLPPKTDCVIFSIDGSFTASVSIMGKDPKVRAGAVDVVRYWQDLGYLIIYVTARPDMQQRKVVDWLAQHNFPHGMVSFMDGLSADPLRQKMNFLKSLVNDAQIVVRAAYGSTKDINVYQNLGLTSDRIFIIGRASKKQQGQASVITEGYATHLSDLQSFGGAKPVLGNARLVLRRGCFGLPGQLKRNKSSSRKLAKRAASLPPAGTPTNDLLPMKLENTIDEAAIGVDTSGQTIVNCSGSQKTSRVRGTSPRTPRTNKQPTYRFETKI